MKSLLRWAGSKRQLLGELKEYWSAAGATRYIEPFAGSAALFFEIAPKTAILNDVNSDLIGFYRGIKKNPKAVYDLACSMEVNEKTYYSIRSTYREDQDSITKAAKFYYLNRYCFNGIYRTNLAGEFNVPFAKEKTGNFPKWNDVALSISQLRKAKTLSLDFEKLVTTNVAKGDFVYLDPPYAVENTRIFTQYNATTFGSNDLLRLQKTLEKIDSSGASFVMSYASCEEAISLFANWNHRGVQCQRNVAGFAKHRRKAEELIFTNIDFKG